MDAKYDITLYVYDITNGLARALSPQFLGYQIEGVWHSSIVVYGIEYYFQGGIARATPRATPFGQPTKTIKLGETEVPKEVLEEFILEIRDQYTEKTYDLIDRNCNHFTNELSAFLLSKEIPAEIKDQAKNLYNSPQGQLFKPLIEGFRQQVNNNPQTLQNSGLLGQQLGGFQNQQSPSFPQPTVPQPNQGGQTTTQPQVYDKKKTIEVASLDEYIDIISNPENKGFVVDFYTDWCGPCKAIKPIFAQYSEEYSAKCPGLKFLSVNTEKAKTLAEQFEVQSIPTFVTIADGNQLAKWSGGNQVTLKAQIEKLITQINKP